MAALSFLVLKGTKDSQTGTVACMGGGLLESGLITICSSRVGAYSKGGSFEDLQYGNF